MPATGSLDEEVGRHRRARGERDGAGGGGAAAAAAPASEGRLAAGTAVSATAVLVASSALQVAVLQEAPAVVEVRAPRTGVHRHRRPPGDASPSPATRSRH